MTNPRPLHIAVATRAAAPQHGYGGLERAVTQHLGALAQRGIRCTVFTQPADPALPPPKAFGGWVDWQTVPYRQRQLPLRHNAIPDRLLHYPRFARTLGAAIVAQHQITPFTVVQTHGLAGLGYAEQLRAATTPALPPLVLNPHGMEEFSRQHRLKWLAYAPFRHGIRRIAHQSARIIATDRALLRPIAHWLTVPAAQITLLPNGVVPEELDRLVAVETVRDLTARYQLADSPLTLISVARLEQNKGLADGIAALAQLQEALPTGWHWLIVGTGSQEAALRQLIADNALTAQIKLVGALPDHEVHALFAAADLALVPSLYEGSSLAALEALAHRLPVVATTVGGLPDKIIPGETGFLATPGKPDSLAQAIAAALAARNQWQQMGEAGRTLVETDFSWASLAASYEQMYRDLAGS